MILVLAMQSPRSGMFHPFPGMAAYEDRQRMVTLKSDYRPGTRSRASLTHESFKKAMPLASCTPQRVATARAKSVHAQPPECGTMGVKLRTQP